MSDELKPRESIDSGTFRELLWDFQHHPGSVVAINALIAHIDAWGARMTGVPNGWQLVPIEPTERMRKAAASWGDPDAINYPNGYSMQRGDEAVESYRYMLAAAPTHDKEDA